MLWIELLLGALMTVLHYFSEEFSGKIEKFHNELVSFSGGLFITLIFVFLLPEFVKGQEFLGESIFVLLVCGFVVFHVAEKYIYQHVLDKKRLMKDLAEFHAMGFFVDHFVVGMAIVFAFQSGGSILGFIVFIPLLLHTFASSVSLTQIDDYFKQSQAVNIVLSIAPLAGIIAAELLNPDRAFYHTVFSLVVGALMYVSIRDMLPKKDKGKSVFFVAGFLIGLAIIYSAKFLMA